MPGVEVSVHSRRRVRAQSPPRATNLRAVSRGDSTGELDRESKHPLPPK